MTGFSEGDAVAVEPTLFCGTCAECRAGLTNLCPSLGFHGLSGGGGGYAEFTVVPASMARPLGSVPTDLGALVEPLAVGLHAVRSSGVGSVRARWSSAPAQSGWPRSRCYGRPV